MRISLAGCMPFLYSCGHNLLSNGHEYFPSFVHLWKGRGTLYRLVDVFLCFLFGRCTAQCLLRGWISTSQGRDKEEGWYNLVMTFVCSWMLIDRSCNQLAVHVLKRSIFNWSKPGGAALEQTLQLFSICQYLVVSGRAVLIAHSMSLLVLFLSTVSAISRVDAFLDFRVRRRGAASCLLHVASHNLLNRFFDVSVLFVCVFQVVTNIWMTQFWQQGPTLK